MTQLVTYLEGLGLVERVADPGDGRAVIVRPTAAAHRGYEVARRRVAEIEAAWEAHVGSRRWSAFKKTLLELAAAPPLQSDSGFKGAKTLEGSSFQPTPGTSM